MSRKRKKDAPTGNSDKVKFLAGSGVNLTYRDLKRKAIILGMPFPDALKAGVFDLIGYIQKTNNKPDLELINKYDDWADKILSDSGIPQDDPIRSSRLRLGFLGEMEDEEQGIRKSKRIPGIKKEKKPKREKDEQGHYKGTKKSYTWECALKGFDLERTKRRVLKKFPDANEKSIRLWYKAALKTQVK